jgi:RHS repeat-associated protein
MMGKAMARARGGAISGPHRLPRAVIVALASVLLTGASAAQDVVEYYQLDSVGNVLVVTNAQGAVVEEHDYLPFGEELCGTVPCGAPTGGQPRRFTGKERDAETGLDYFGARYYQAKLARFTTVDPVYTWRDNLVDPQRWNRYAYGRNNPLKYVDPDGKAIWWIAIPLALFYVANNPTPANVTTGPSVEPILPNSVVTLFVLGAYAAYAGLTSAQPDLPSPDKKGGETPFTKAGRLAHKEEPLPEGFEREVRLPSGKRMDGYNADQKKVIEIKPDKPAAVRRGQRQVGGYCQECDQHHGPGHSGAVQTYDPAKYLEKTNKKE